MIMKDLQMMTGGQVDRGVWSQANALEVLSRIMGQEAFSWEIQPTVEVRLKFSSMGCWGYQRSRRRKQIPRRSTRRLGICLADANTTVSTLLSY